MYYLMYLFVLYTLFNVQINIEFSFLVRIYQINSLINKNSQNRYIQLKLNDITFNLKQISCALINK